MKYIVLFMGSIVLFTQTGLAGTQLPYMGAVLKYSKKHHMDHNLVLAVISVESNFDPNAVGGLGELGLMQLRPEYHYNGEDLLDPEVNLKIGIAYLAKLRDKFQNRYQRNLWLQLYNSGYAKPPRQFTYYDKVMREYERRLAKQNKEQPRSRKRDRYVATRE